MFGFDPKQYKMHLGSTLESKKVRFVFLKVQLSIRILLCGQFQILFGGEVRGVFLRISKVRVLGGESVFKFVFVFLIL